MFEEYLQDAYDFLIIAENTPDTDERKARRYYRASVFYASGAIEAFLNYIADSFQQAESIDKHEISFLNDKAIVFSLSRGVHEKTEFHKIDEKLKLIIRKFSPMFDFQSVTWVRFMEFKEFRDSLVHPRQTEDDMLTTDYHKKVRAGVTAIIELMGVISNGVFQKPLRKKLLDLIPE